MKWAIVAIGLSMVCLSCTPNITRSRVDSFTGSTYTEMKAIKIYGPFMGNCEVWTRFIIKDDTTRYYQLTYLGKDWLFIGKIHLKIDGQIKSVEVTPTREVLDDAMAHAAGYFVREIAFIRLKPETMKALAYASTLTLRLEGSTQYLDIDVDSGDRAEFKNFYDQYVSKTPSLH